MFDDCQFDNPIFGASQAEVVKKLRQLADHIEDDDWPRPYTFSVTNVKGSPFTEVKLILSVPWGG